MRPRALIFLVLSAVATTSQAGPRLVMGQFRAPGLNTTLQTFLPEHLAQQLQSQGLDVVSARDITTALGYERQRQLLGCTETNCELAGALGAEGIVVGEVANLGGAWVVNIKIISATAAKPLAIFSTRVAKKMQLADAIERAAVELAATVLAIKPAAPKPHPPEAAQESRPPPADPQPAPAPKPALLDPKPAVRLTAGEPSRAPAIITGCIGLAALGVATALALMAKSNHDALMARGRATPLSTDEALRLANLGASYQAFSVGAFALGGAAAVASVIWLFVGRAPAISAVPTADGAVLVVGGRFP